MIDVRKSKKYKAIKIHKNEGERKWDIFIKLQNRPLRIRFLS